MFHSGYTFHSNPCHCCQAILLKTVNVNLMVVLQPALGFWITKVSGLHLLGTLPLNAITIHHIFGDIC